MTTTEDARNTYIEYLSGVASLSPEEKLAHLRHDYRHTDQAWPDYLDFIEEWDEKFEERLVQTRKQFLYCLATRNQRVICGKHFHELTTRSSEVDGVVVIGSADAFIDTDSCLWNTLIQSEQLIISHEEVLDACRLTSTEHEYLKRLVRLSIIVHDGLPGTKVDFETFRDKWWHNPTQDNALKLLRESEPSSPAHNIIANMRKNFPRPDPQFLHQKEKQVDVIWAKETVEKDHGLHTLLDGAQDGVLIFQIINRIRRYVGKDEELRPDKLLESMSNCEFCKIRSHRRKPSFPAVYYAPPGNGKTTALRKEVFVGVDTDWLLKNSTFSYIISPFLEMGIPVITNQYHLCMNAGSKMFGLYNEHSLRNDFSGKPFTEPSEILAAKQAIGSDLCLLLDNQYFDSASISLFRLSFLYNLTQQIFSQQPITFELKEKFVKYTDTRFINQYLTRLKDNPAVVARRKKTRMKKQRKKASRP